MAGSAPGVYPSAEGQICVLPSSSLTPEDQGTPTRKSLQARWMPLLDGDPGLPIRQVPAGTTVLAKGPTTMGQLRQREAAGGAGLQRSAGLQRGSNRPVSTLVYLWEGLRAYPFLPVDVFKRAV